MRDGRYEYEFIAYGDHGSGTLAVVGDMAEGGDEVHVLRGRWSLTGTNLLASFDVRHRAPEHAARAYTIRLSGSGTDVAFNVIGLGPLGLIVELRGQWIAAT